MGFDGSTLHPTYSLTWGVAGPSMALSIAQGLGFDPDILAAARDRLAGGGASASSAAQGPARQSLRGLAEEVGGLREERAAAERALEAALRERATAEAELLACEREAANVEERMAQEVGRLQRGPGCWWWWADGLGNLDALLLWGKARSGGNLSPWVPPPSLPSICTGCCG